MINCAIEALYYQRLHTPHNIDKHLPLLRKLAEECQHITEFGTDQGFSTTAFLAACPKELHSYDIHFYHPNLPIVINSRPPKVKWTRTRANTLEIEIEPTDLLFIDTEHTYEQVKGELQRHGNNARKYIALHDIVSFPGIVPAIKEWLDDHVEWSIKEWSTIQSGMAVLERCGVSE